MFTAIAIVCLIAAALIYGECKNARQRQRNWESVLRTRAKNAK